MGMRKSCCMDDEYYIIKNIRITILTYNQSSKSWENDAVLLFEMGSTNMTNIYLVDRDESKGKYLSNLNS